MFRMNLPPLHLKIVVIWITGRHLGIGVDITSCHTCERGVGGHWGAEMEPSTRTSRVNLLLAFNVKKEDHPSQIIFCMVLHCRLEIVWYSLWKRMVELLFYMLMLLVILSYWALCCCMMNHSKQRSSIIFRRWVIRLIATINSATHSFLLITSALIDCNSSKGPHLTNTTYTYIIFDSYISVNKEYKQIVKIHIISKSLLFQ